MSPEDPTFPFSEASLRVHRHATLQQEGPTFPLSEECLHEAANINNHEAQQIALQEVSIDSNQ